MEQALPSISQNSTYQLLKSSEQPPWQLESQHSCQRSEPLRSVAPALEEDQDLWFWDRDSSLGCDHGSFHSGVCCGRGRDRDRDLFHDHDHVLGDDLGHDVSLECNKPQFHAASTTHIPRYNHTPESRSLMSDLIAGAEKGDYGQKSAL